MSMMSVAQKLVEGCRTGQAAANLDRLYAPDAVSVEAMPMQEGGSRETAGLDGIKGKHEWWEQNFEVQDGNVSDPLPHGDDRFAVIFEMTAKNRNTGEVSEMKEVAVYHVADDRIVREEFFYGA